MIHTRVFSLLFFTSAALSQSAHFSSQPAQASCPVELTASWNGTGKMLPITSRPKNWNTGEERRLRIVLRNPGTAVASARVTVHGFPTGVRLQPAVLYFPDDPAEIRETIALDLTVGMGQIVRFDLALPTFGAVTSIDLDSLIYADGSTWQPERHSACRAVSLSLDAVSDAGSRQHPDDAR